MIIVLGQPRTGTSLLMQMLHVAGADCLGEWPAFEPLELNPAFADVEATLATLGENQAAKVNWYPLVDVPDQATVLYTSRNAVQQATSEQKMMKATLPVFANRHMPGSWIDDAACRIVLHQEQMVDATRRSNSMHVEFGAMILEPLTTARRVVEHIGFGDPGHIAKCVVPRLPNCYAGMLEFDLMKTGAPT
ncbi:MAG: hypothetical protein AAFN78_01060 [Pseudomonadota bacterium]